MLSVPGGLAGQKKARPSWHAPLSLTSPKPSTQAVDRVPEVCVDADGSVWQWLYRPTSPVAANVQSRNPSPPQPSPAAVVSSRFLLGVPDNAALDRHGVTLLIRQPQTTTRAVVLWTMEA